MILHSLPLHQLDTVLPWRSLQHLGQWAAGCGRFAKCGNDDATTGQEIGVTQSAVVDTERTEAKVTSL